MGRSPIDSNVFGIQPKKAFLQIRPSHRVFFQQQLGKSNYNQFNTKENKLNQENNQSNNQKKTVKSFFAKAAPKSHKLRTTSKHSNPNNVNTKIEISVYDILYIDSQIFSILKNKESFLNSLTKKIKIYKWIVNNNPDPLDRKNASEQIPFLRSAYTDIKFGFHISLYILQSQDIVKEYKRILKQTKSNSFMKKSRNNKTEALIYRKNELILRYLSIAKNYILTNNIIFKNNKTVCSNCFGCDFIASEDDAVLSCKHCGCVIEHLDDNPSFKDTDRANMSSRYMYTCKGHFDLAICNFEGNQNIEIEEESNVLKLIKEEMVYHSLTDQTVTKDHIYIFLNERKLSAYYEHINLLYFYITKKECPNISEYKNELLEMHDDIEKAYNNVKNERVNSLNVNYKLFKLLQILGFKCKKDDFYFLKTPNKLSEHDEIWREVIDYLRKLYPDAKTSKGYPKWIFHRSI